MPFGDGTGPTGQGPRTGRGMGNCAGQGVTGRGLGLGRGRGFGGRGRRIDFSANQGNSWLENQLDNLQAAIQRLAERLDKFNKE